MRAFQLGILIALVAAAPATAQSRESEDRSMSAPRDFLGVYVTNFEISYFVECVPEQGTCDDWIRQEHRWLRGGSPESATRFNDCIAALNGSRDRWALYAISFQGRETLDRQPKAFLHDTEHHVFIDDLSALELIGTSETVEANLPRYRRHPTDLC